MLGKLIYHSEKLQLERRKQRHDIAKRKFYTGLYAEYTGLALCDGDYIQLEQLRNRLNIACTLLDNPDLEHRLYTLGLSFINDNKDKKTPLKKNFSCHEELEKYRFHQLVTIGAEIENYGLTQHTRAALVGAYLVTMRKLDEY